MGSCGLARSSHARLITCDFLWTQSRNITAWLIFLFIQNEGFLPTCLRMRQLTASDLFQSCQLRSWPRLYCRSCCFFYNWIKSTQWNVDKMQPRDYDAAVQWYASYTPTGHRIIPVFFSCCVKIRASHGKFTNVTWAALINVLVNKWSEGKSSSRVIKRKFTLF